MARWQKGLVVAACFVFALIVAGGNLFPKLGGAAWAASYCDQCSDAERARLQGVNDEFVEAFRRDAAILFVGLAVGIWWIVRPPRNDKEIGSES